MPESPEEGFSQRCNLTISTTGIQVSGIDLRVTPHHNLSPPVHTLGPGESRGQIPGDPPNSYWFFFFEVTVQLPYDDWDPNDWEPFQSSIRTGTVTILARNRYIEASLDAVFLDDSPGLAFRDTLSSGYYFWVDAPDYPMVATVEVNGREFTGPVESLHLQRLMFFELRNKKNPWKSCSGFLGLTLDVNSSGDWNWTVTR
jgi:hypothetical protein